MAKLNIVEQHISTVKLEKQRKDACRKNWLVRKSILPTFLLFMVFPTINLVKYLVISNSKTPTSIKNQVIYYVFHDGMIAAIISATIVGVFYFLYLKSYKLFTNNFKNKYLVDTLKSIAGFSDLDYKQGMSFQYEEIVESAIIPAGLPTIFMSKDNLTGSYKNVNFRSGNITTATSAGRHVQELFTGQLIEFSYFDKSKISDGRVQVFSNKSLAFYENLYRESNDSAMGWQRLSHKIETEDVEFGQRFSVYGDEEHNAFYILTPQVLERIKALADAVDNDVYLVFEERKLYVAFRSPRNPFDAFTDVPVEEQRKFIEKDAKLLQRAVEILIKD